MAAPSPPEARPGGSRFRPDVEGLRAIAVLLVMIYHAGLVIPSGGFAGVDVFFVVSGFVITSQLLRELERDGRISLLTFYGRRAKRLLPAAGVVIVVTAIAAWLLAPATQWRVIAHDLVGSAAYVVNWVLAGRAVDYLAEDVQPSPVLHFWSLAVEEQFYLIWPLIIILLTFVAARVGAEGARRRRILATGLCAVIILPSLTWALYLTSTDPSRAFFVTTTRLWELGVGALVAIGAAWWTRIPGAIAAVIGWAGLATILIGSVLQSSSTPWPGPGALVPVLGTAAVIVGGVTAGRAGPVRVLGSRALVWIGGLSYSLYLWHWTVLRIYTWQFGEPNALVGLVVVASATLPAWLCFRFIERPIRYSTSLNTSPGLALSVGLNVTIASIAAGLVLWLAAASATVSGTSGGDQLGDDGQVDLAEPVEVPVPGPGAIDEPPLYPRLTPDPLLATEDRPELYDRGCQVDQVSEELVPCESGDPDGEVVVAVVGDSKIAQWVPAIDRIAEANHWRVVSNTKSSCTPTAATIFHLSEEYVSCAAWGANVQDWLLHERPDAVIISGGREDAGESLDDRSVEQLSEGYRQYWQKLSDAGIKVILISDSPYPDLGRPAYECVAEAGIAAEEMCTWAYERTNGSQALEAAAGQVPGSRYVDLDPWICPDGTCYSVFRNIVTYRQGSHLTDTFINYLTPALAYPLVAAVNEG